MKLATSESFLLNCIPKKCVTLFLNDLLLISRKTHAFFARHLRIRKFLNQYKISSSCTSTVMTFQSWSIETAVNNQFAQCSSPDISSCVLTSLSTVPVMKLVLFTGTGLSEYICDQVTFFILDFYHFPHKNLHCYFFDVINHRSECVLAKTYQQV